MSVGGSFSLLGSVYLGFNRDVAKVLDFMTATADDALARANSAHERIESHEDLCAERYKNLHANVDEIKSTMRRFGGAMFVTLIGVLGWLLAYQVNSYDDENDLLR